MGGDGDRTIGIQEGKCGEMRNICFCGDSRDKRKWEM